MQKAIFYVSKLMAARGVLELTDRALNFEVSSLDASFGIKNVAIDLDNVIDIKIESGDLNPRIVLITETRKYEFVLSGGQELYDRLRDVVSNPNIMSYSDNKTEFSLRCACGKDVNKDYSYCPWCGAEM